MSIQPLIVALALTVGLATQATFAGDTSIAGVGRASPVSVHTGQSAISDVSTGIAGVVHTGGIGSPARASVNIGNSFEAPFSAGPAKPKSGGIGHGTQTASGKTYNVPMVHGIGPGTGNTGGRGN